MEKVHYTKDDSSVHVVSDNNHSPTKSKLNPNSDSSRVSYGALENVRPVLVKDSASAEFDKEDSAGVVENDVSAKFIYTTVSDPVLSLDTSEESLQSNSVHDEVYPVKDENRKFVKAKKPSTAAKSSDDLHTNVNNNSIKDEIHDRSIKDLGRARDADAALVMDTQPQEDLDFETTESSLVNSNYDDTSAYHSHEEGSTASRPDSSVEGLDVSTTISIEDEVVPTIRDLRQRKRDKSRAPSQSPSLSSVPSASPSNPIGDVVDHGECTEDRDCLSESCESVAKPQIDRSWKRCASRVSNTKFVA